MPKATAGTCCSEHGPHSLFGDILPLKRFACHTVDMGVEAGNAEIFYIASFQAQSEILGEEKFLPMAVGKANLFGPHSNEHGSL
jgi:hypothetical protein